MVAIRFSDAAKFDKALPQQNAAWEYLFSHAPAEAWDAFQAKVPDTITAEFANRFRLTSLQTPSVKTTALVAGKNPLPVPYFSQRDNYRDASRTCFSSSCAMALKFLKPNSIKNDDDYISRVFAHGDTTDSVTQIQTLRTYGINSTFVTNGTFDLIRRQIDKSIPVPFGWLHRGNVSLPVGGGHWAIAIGYDSKGLIVNDPWGEADLVNGTTISGNGQSLHYSYANLGPRWMVNGNDGWCLIIS